MNPGASSKTVISRAFLHTVLLTYLGLVVFPMVWLLYTSLKQDGQIFLNPFALPPLDDLRWDNFSRAWNGAHFSTYFLNSLVVTGASVLSTLVFGSMAAYALAKMRVPGGQLLYLVFLAGLMLPIQLAVVPLFFQMRDLGLLGSRFGLIVVYTATSLPFAIFVLTAFFRALPKSLQEAARIDGCGEIRTFWSIMLPLARPGIVTVAIFTVLGVWNEYFLAFMFLSGEGGEGARTLPLGLADIAIASQYRSDWGVAFAGLVLVTIPSLIFYLFLQRHIIKGITSGAVKG